MPFKSEKQRRFMWSQHPEIAQRWADEEKGKGKRQRKRKRQHVPKKDSRGYY